MLNIVRKGERRAESWFGAIAVRETAAHLVVRNFDRAAPRKKIRNAGSEDAAINIAGHGFTEQGPVSREELRTYHQALGSVIAEATRLYKAGVPVDQAVKQANWGEYASWTLASSQGPIAIRRVYDELSGRLR